MTKTSAYTSGEKVAWNWAQGTGEGTVRTVYTERVTLTLKGSDITRNASEDNPAYRIRQEDGDEVLKSHSELHKAD